jgi:hypothetical protein
MQHPLFAKLGTIFADKQWLLSWYSSLADYGRGVCMYVWVVVKVLCYKLEGR